MESRRIIFSFTGKELLQERVYTTQASGGISIANSSLQDASLTPTSHAHNGPRPRTAQPHSRDGPMSCLYARHTSPQLPLIQAICFPLSQCPQTAKAISTTQVTLPLPPLRQEIDQYQLPLRYAVTGTIVNAGLRTAATSTYVSIAVAITKSHNALRETQPSHILPAWHITHVSCPTSLLSLTDPFHYFSKLPSLEYTIPPLPFFFHYLLSNFHTNYYT